MKESFDMTRKRTEKRDEKMLTVKEAKFVSEYLADPDSNRLQAALKSGHKTLGSLMKRPHVVKELKARMKKIMSKKQVTAERVVEELARIAFANIDDFVDDDYRIQQRPSRRKMAAVQEVTTETIIDRSGGKDADPEDREDVKRVKMKMYSKLDALDKLGRHFGIYNDSIEITSELGERLDRAFVRLAGEGAEPKK